MSATTKIKTTLASPIDRVSFLKLTLGAVVALIGVTRFVTFLSERGAPPASKQESNGYGSSPYGR